MVNTCSEERSSLLLSGVSLASYVLGTVLRPEMTMFLCKTEIVID